MAPIPEVFPFAPLEDRWSYPAWIRGLRRSNGVYVFRDRETGEISFGEVPPYAVVVPGAMPSDKGGPNLYCAVIVKRVDEKTRSKTSINDLLRN